jgi:branched-chain amino acid transport system substrate-binding protein
MHGRVLRFALGMLGAALAAVLAVAVVGCSSGANTTGTTSAEPIKIGVIVSLTGTNAGLGDAEKKAIEMEVKKINDAGGINGRQVEVVIEDDASDETKAVAAASKLIEQDKVVAIIGASGTGTSMAVRTEIDRAGIPEVSMAGGSVITSKFDPLVFQTPWSNTLVVPFTLDYMKKQGITKIGLISDTGAFGKDGAAIIASDAPEAGMTIASTQTFNVGDTDMTAQLTNIKNSGAQAVLMWTSGKEAATVVKNAKQMGLTIPVYGSHGNARMEFVQGAGDASEAFRFAAGKVLLPETYGKDSAQYKTATEFVDSYTAAYGAAPSTFAGHAYDGLYLVTEAAKRVTGELTPTALRDEIERTANFAGIGGVFTFSPTDHNGMTASDLNMYEVKGGTWTIAP